MKYCKDCWGFDRCEAQGRTVDFPVDDGVCCDFDPIMPMTNADRIRAMTDEELMQLLFTKISCGNICSFCVPTMRTESKCDGHCRNGVLKWLQQPAEGDA